jgi:hypothetical protein
VFELHSSSPYSCMDNLSAYPVLLSFLSYLKYFIGRLGSYPYQLVRGNIMSTDVDSSSIICANFGYALRLSTNSSRHGKSQTSHSGKVRCNQPAKQHPQLPRRESLPRAIYFSENVSILIQDLSSFKDDCSVAFSMAHSVMLNNVEIYL